MRLTLIVTFLLSLAVRPLTAQDATGSVPDPIVEEFDRELAELQALLATTKPDHDASWTRNTWPTSPIAGFLSSPELARFEQWDRNVDGTVDAEELRFALEVLWGIRHETGVRLRSEGGIVVFWRAFQDRDSDRDLRLTVEEVARWSSPAGLDWFKEILKRFDHDGDGRLSLAEAVQTDMFRRDLHAEFRQLDSDGDGLVSLEQLSQGMAPWEQGYLDQVFPGFDDDSDGNLTVDEFRASPAGNPYRDWRPRDANGDGSISFEEYHGDSSAAHFRLSRMFFERLDRNSDGGLSLDEIAFEIDLTIAPPEVVFRELDGNVDGRLSVTEAAGAPPPSRDDLTAQRHYQEKLMRIEDAFRRADKDRDGSLSAGEFQNSGEALALIVPGREAPAAVLPAVSSSPGSRQQHLPGGEGAEPWDRTLIALVSFNLVLLAGLAWLVFRSSHRK